MRIAIVGGASKKNDSFRGIGVQNSELFRALKLEAGNDLEITEINSDFNYSEFDIVHFSAFRPFFISVPFFKPKNTKFVLTIHDMHPLIYPEHFPSGIKGMVRFLINKFLIWKNVDQIITISETSKKDICRFLKVDPNMVSVIYLAPKPDHKVLKRGKWVQETLKKYRLPSKFGFYLGDINYVKNIPRIIKACKKIDLPVIFVGKQINEIEKMDLNHPENSHLKPVYKDIVNSKLVIRLGFLSDEELNKILNLSVCMLFPSFYEGFGLSVVHGFASGSPVIAGKTQTLVEVGGEACLYVDPYSIDDIAEKVNMFVKSESLRQEYIKKGLERVKKFSWKKAAKETLEVYAKA